MSDTPFWKAHSKARSGASGDATERVYDNGSAIVLGGFPMDRRGEPQFDGNALKGKVLAVYGNPVPGVAVGGDATIELNEVTKKALRKGAGTDKDPNTCILKGVRADEQGKVTASYGHTLGEGRMGVVGVVEQPVLFCKGEMFSVARATPEQIEKVTTVLAACGAGVHAEPRDGQATTEEQRAKWVEAQRNFPVSVSARVMYPEKAKLLSSGADVEALRVDSNNIAGLRFAMRVWVVGQDGQPIMESDKVAAFTPKFDKDAGYELPAALMEGMEAKAKAAGGTIAIEAIPYRTMYASKTTDGSYDCGAVKMAKEMLEQASNARTVRAVRASAYQPGFIVTTAKRNEQTGRSTPGVMVRLPEGFSRAESPAVPSMSGLVTPNLDGSKVRLVQTMASGADEGATAAREAPKPPEAGAEHEAPPQASAQASAESTPHDPAPGDAAQDEFDAAAAPALGG